jgi:DNA-binding CsgD family transcriptional regulator
VPLAPWAAVAEREEEVLIAAAEQAAAAHLVVVPRDGTRVQFAHALFREALYDGILPLRRRSLHRRAGERLAAERDPDPDAVAYQLLQAGDDRAAPWLVAAGTRARHAFALATAIDRYERALALMARDEAAPGERGWVAYLLAVTCYYAAPARGISLLTTVIGDAARAGDRTLEALARFQRGLIRSAELTPGALDEMAAAVRVLDAQPPGEIARIRHHLDSRYSPDSDRAAVARELALVGRFAEALPLAERLVADGQDPLGEPYADGAWTLGLRAAVRGEAAVAGRWLAQAHAAWCAIGNGSAALGVIADELVALLAFAADEPEALAWVDAEAARIGATVRESGLAHYADLVMLPLRIVRGEWRDVEARHPPAAGADDSPSLLAPGPFLAPLPRYLGDRAAVRRYVAALLPLGARTEPGDMWFIAATVLQRVSAGAALDAGDLPAAKDWLEAHDRWLAWAGAVLGRAEGQLGWAAYHRAAGDATAAREHAEVAIALAAAPRQPLALLAAHRLLGELDTAAGRHPEAAKQLSTALALAAACGAPYERALSLLALAELRTAEGQCEAAGAALAEAQAILAPLGAAPALARADSLATRLAAGPPTPTTAYPASLTAREVAVLRLIAAGRTNREIAALLHLSPNTVLHHVTHILNKTGAENRAAAVAFALRHGLGESGDRR